MSPPLRNGPYARTGQYPRSGQPLPNQPGRPGTPGQPAPGQPAPGQPTPGQAGRAASGRGGQEADGRSGQLIKQRNAAVPERHKIGGTQAIAAIAPDGLDAFARDLRALRAKAELDYPEMAERSHYTMKTLASAAGGLRLPTLPVAIAYVRACDGDGAEWEERWHKLAEKIGADKPDSEEPPAEPDDATPPPEPPQAKAADSAEVYVITSAKPKQQGW
jgi:hypothetical protein